MKKLYQKLIEYDMKMIVEPKNYIKQIWFWFSKDDRTSDDPVMITMDAWERHNDVMEDLLLRELDCFISCRVEWLESPWWD